MARHHGLRTRGIDSVPQSPLHEGRFGRMFPGLPVHEFDLGFLRDLADGMQTEGDGEDNPTIPAGFTYLGQFVDHDLTFDPVSSFQRSDDPEALVSFRSPRFDLDSVYGRGPDDDPFLYDQGPGDLPGVERPEHPDDEQDPDKREYKFLLGRITGPDASSDAGTPLTGFGEGNDLPRNRQGRALIGDPRNDENTIVAQLHLAFLKFHNRLVDHVAETKELRGGELFAEAQRLARWHYQWVIVHDFLPRIIGDRLSQFLEKVDGREEVTLRFYDPGRRRAFIPIEFSVAAYRFGHSQVRRGYAINNIVGGGDEPLPIFTFGPLNNRIQDFRGFRSLPQLWTVQWPFFFGGLDDGALRPQLSLKINTQLAKSLFDLPAPAFDIDDATEDDERSLARRNLRRGLKARLPSGGRIARAMGVPLDQRPTKEQLGFRGPAPLWYYILKEAEVFHDGEHLGPVGATIVAETFLGVLNADPGSYLSVEPGWQPELQGESEGTFTMNDLLRFAVPEQAKFSEIVFPGAPPAPAPAP